MEDLIKCPHCGKSHFVVLYQTSTLVHSPLEYKDGKWFKSDPNMVIAHCHCLECGKEFGFLL
jgi:hypothetical protein